MPRAGLLHVSEKWGALTRLLRSDMTQCSEFEFDHGSLAKPIGWGQGSQYTERANAGSAVEGKWQQQKFQFDFDAVRGAPNNAGDCPNVFTKNGDKQFFDVLLARVIPKAVEVLALNLAGKQRADAGTSKTEPYVVHEVCRKHKCIAKNVLNIGWIDIGSRGCPAPTSPPVPIVKQFTRCSVFHCGTCSAATRSSRLCLRSGQPRRPCCRDIA
jgi:hypothetical protein